MPKEKKDRRNRNQGTCQHTCGCIHPPNHMFENRYYHNTVKNAHPHCSSFKDSSGKACPKRSLILLKAEEEEEKTKQTLQSFDRVLSVMCLQTKNTWSVDSARMLFNALVSITPSTSPMQPFVTELSTTDEITRIFHSISQPLHPTNFPFPLQGCISFAAFDTLSQCHTLLINDKAMQSKNEQLILQTAQNVQELVHQHANTNPNVNVSSIPLPILPSTNVQTKSS